MLASATESKTSSTTAVAQQTGAPAWRIVLGNVAAGATAGCAVEAGTSSYSGHVVTSSLLLPLCGFCIKH